MSRLLSFRDVIAEELDYLRRRKEKIEQDVTLKESDGLRHGTATVFVPETRSPAEADRLGTHSQRAEAGASETLLTDEEYKQILKSDLVGLSISGGGIRSATFGLGVIQGLASAGLLPRIDYLSTVSGGGYIGGWLVAWIKRLGLTDVTKELTPARFDHKTPEHVEADAVRHLRLYSNYLAPRVGLFSLDSWVLIAIYLRNLFLNQLALFAVLLSLFGLARATLGLFSLTHSVGRESLLLGVAVTAACSAVYVLWAATYRYARSNANEPTEPNEDLWVVIASVLAVAVFGSLCFSAMPTGEWLNFSSRTALVWQLDAFVGPVVMALVMAAFHGTVGWVMITSRDRVLKNGSSERRQWDDYWEGRRIDGANAEDAALLDRWRALGWGIVSGVVGGMLLSIGLKAVFMMRPQVAAFAVLAPVTIVSSFVIANFVQIGLMGEMLQRYDRERWSSLNARCLVLVAQWLFVMSVVVYGPAAVIRLIHVNWGPLMATVLSSSWLATVLASLRATSVAASNSGRRGWQSYIAFIGPYVFVFGLMLVLSTGANCLVYQAFHFVAPDWEQGQEHYLADLDLPLKHPAATVKAAVLFAGLIVIGSAIAIVLPLRMGFNRFTLQDLYAFRLTRCYLGATNSHRRPDAYTNFDPTDDLYLDDLLPEAVRNGTVPLDDKHTGPFPIINAALNRTAVNTARRSGSHADASVVSQQREIAETLAFQERKAESFTMTPFHCGSITTKYCDTRKFDYHVKLGTAMAVSGAAVSPNMGYQSDPAQAAFLTAFNVRLGSWFVNPRRAGKPPRARLLRPLRYLGHELVGHSTATAPYVYVSDGGHFENMGVYELIRRRCRFIIAIDTWADPDAKYENLGRLVRLVRVDMGIHIEINTEETVIGPNKLAMQHFAVGRIHYGDVHHPDPNDKEADVPLYDPNFCYPANQGVLIYLKPALTGDEPQDLLNYRAENPQFPQHPISDQFFDEAQFESYRRLGLHTVDKLLEGDIVSASSLRSAVTTKRFVQTKQGSQHRNTVAASLGKKSNQDLFTWLYNRWMPLPPNRLHKNYPDLNAKYGDLMERMANVSELMPLADCLFLGERWTPISEDKLSTQKNAERFFTLEMFNLLGTAWNVLELDRYWRYPINSGWINVFRRWLQAPRGRELWNEVSNEFSEPFQKFVQLMAEEWRGKPLEPGVQLDTLADS